MKAVFKGCETVKSIMGTEKYCAACMLHIIMHTPESRTREKEKTDTRQVMNWSREVTN